MRLELREAVAGLLASADAQEPQELTEDEIERLAALATYACKARSAVERDRMSREVELILGEEGPARLAQTLAALLDGITALGVTREHAWRVVTKCALDSIPAIRRTMLDALLNRDKAAETAAIAESAGYPTITARRALEELTIYGLAVRTRMGKGKSDLWSLSQEARELYREGVSAMSDKDSCESVLITPNPMERDIAETPNAADVGDWRDLLSEGAS
jgi:hypothetical protein